MKVLKSSNKISCDWIIEEGPLRDNLFDDERRYETIGVEDRLIDWFWDNIEDTIKQNVSEFKYDW